ncbi:hypothetical protein FW778_15765 [Ginsengibacter hankyongi]|uniref:Uncharacterized protein n=1 Tax=Ginsengibacter hankyongi TaxID=2607284 RepID=A0A5J5IGV5_9BACT|nr:hypothetical protein [Ginsengibacter hankyongi]KAA9038204.1 hypothetical protein FW778_15765 [Ginsengibacter hankyongi]
MKKVWFVIAIASLYALAFQAAIFTGISDQIIFGMFAFSPFVILYMAYVILKNGEPSPYTFEEKFYDDFDYFRNGREKLNVENYHSFNP